MKKVPISLNNKTILVTGSPGFIGANLVLRLLKEMTGGTIISFDSMNDYYDPKLKEYRLGLIEKAVMEKSMATTKAICYAGRDKAAELKNSEKIKTESAERRKMNSNNSALTENWITVKDINNNIIFLDNKKMVTGVKIQPRNIFIMDQLSQDNVIDKLRTFYNLVDFEFWLIVADRPVDINLYISQLELHLNNVQNPAIRKLVVDDLSKAELFVNNEVVDTEYFILFKDDNTDSLNKKVRTLINNLATCGLIASQTSNDDLRMILDNFLNGGKTFKNRTVMAA